MENTIERLKEIQEDYKRVPSYYDALDEAINVLESTTELQSTTELESTPEVITCKECIHCKYYPNGFHNQYWCNLIDVWSDGTFYCAKGQRSKN